MEACAWLGLRACLRLESGAADEILYSLLVRLLITVACSFSALPLRVSISQTCLSDETD